MVRLCANLSMLFTEVPFLERFAAARSAGFEGVEYMFPYAFSKEDIAEQLRAHGLTQVLFNLPAGNWESGERGIACDPTRADEFRAGVDQAIDYAKALGCRQVNCLVGIPPQKLDAKLRHDTLVDNLRYAARALKGERIVLLIEPVNSYDIPGFHLNRSAPAIALIEEVGSSNVKLQYDVYHMQRMEGELASTIARLLPHVGHIQVADNPGRHEPGTGEINYPFLLDHIDRHGYGGWIGCEYKPFGRTEDGLGWRSKITRT